MRCKAPRALDAGAVEEARDEPTEPQRARSVGRSGDRAARHRGVRTGHERTRSRGHRRCRRAGCPASWQGPVGWQSGFGDVRPQRIFLGGDPTGLVDGIRWSGWGGDRAIGYGDAEYDWPGTAVADNGPTPGARVVAFQLGTCRGRPSYNALEWYFPKYGQVFDPHEYLDTCTGATVGTPNVVSCPKNVRLADGAGTAAFIDVSAISCAAARRLIAQAPAAQYVVSGGRFMQSGFRCGTEGTRGGDSASFDCQRGRLEFAYMLTP